MYYKKETGFTLIELLVVVLIIGILAAIALPQYQKAVMKSHLTQWATYVSSFDKAIDVYLMANGSPATKVRFSGDGTNSDGAVQGTLDVELSCARNEGTSCYTKFGRFHVGCSTTDCFIDFGSEDDGIFPEGESIWTSVFLDGSYGGKRVLAKVPTDTKFRQLVCQYWAANYGTARMTDAVKTDCANVGIN